MKIVFFDSSKQAGNVGITWKMGAAIFPFLNKADYACGVSSLDELFAKLQSLPDDSIDQIQYWGHGSPGFFIIGDDWVSAKGADKIKDQIQRVLKKQGCFWLRTCSSFQGASGKKFAEELANKFDRRVAAHTFLIGLFHSGLVALRPGETPYWQDLEGIVDTNGKLTTPMSSPSYPRTRLFWNSDLWI